MVCIYSRRPRPVRDLEGDAQWLFSLSRRQGRHDTMAGIFVCSAGCELRIGPGENLVWAETLTKASKQSSAVVACKDGSRFIGEIDTFSEEAGNYEILLSNASQVQV